MDIDKLNAINKAEQIFEVLAAKGGENGMFAIARDGFIALKEVNAELEEKNAQLQLKLDNTMSMVDFLAFANPPQI